MEAATRKFLSYSMCLGETLACPGAMTLSETSFAAEDHVENGMSAQFDLTNTSLIRALSHRPHSASAAVSDARPVDGIAEPN